MFNICVIGCGSMSKAVHGPSFNKYAKENSNVNLLACCDLDEDKAKNYASNFGFSKYYTDMNQMLINEHIDAISIIVPVSQTENIVLQVMEYNIPMIIEKPPGLNQRQCENMISKSKSHNILTQVAFNRRYSPLIVSFKELLNKHSLNLEYIKCDFYRNHRKDKDFSTTAIHGIDTTRFLVGSDYKDVRFTYQSLENSPVGNIYLDCTFKNNVKAHLNFIPCAGKSQEEYIINSYDNTFILKHAVGNDLKTAGRITHYENAIKLYDKTGLDMNISNENYICAGFYGENKHFFNHVINNQDIKGNIADGLQSVIIAECIRDKVKYYSF